MRIRKENILILILLTILISSLTLPMLPNVYGIETTLKIGVPGEIDSFNPLTSILSAAQSIIGVMYESMLYLHVNGSYSPWLATGYSVNASALTITFTLRNNIKWHDGQQFTSDDVKFTFDSIMSTPALDRNKFRDFIASVEAPNPTTVIFHLKKAWAPAIYYLGTQWIIPKHIFSAVNITTFKNMDNPIGTGPYKFVKYVPGVDVEFEAFNDYWQGKPAVPKLVYVLYKSTQSMMLDLLAGNIDTIAGATVDPELVATMLKTPNIKVVVRPGNIIRFMGFNLKRYPFNITGVREAIAYAISKEDIVNTVMLGFADPAPDGWIPPYLGFWYNPNIKWRKQNFTKANEILDNLGFHKGSDGIRVTPTGQKMSYSLLTIAGRAEFVRTAELIQGWLKNIGIEITVQTLSLGTVDEKEGVGDFDLGLMGLGVPLEPDFYLYQRFHSSASAPLGTYVPRNWFRYENPEMDKLLEAQRSEIDIQKRREIIYNIQALIARDLPILTLYVKHSITAYRTDKFTGFNEDDGPSSLISIVNIKPIGWTPPITTTTTATTPTTTTTITTTTTTPTTQIQAPGYDVTLIAGVIVIIVIIAVLYIVLRRGKH